MSAQPGKPEKKGTGLFFGLPKNRPVPFFLSLLTLVFLNACASDPPPAAAPEPSIIQPAPEPEWNGSGGASSMLNRGAALVDVAMRLRGAPYRYGGATLDGFDCSGLVFYAHRQLGLDVPRTSRDQAEQSSPVRPTKLRRGDLVFFKIGSRSVNHGGIYIGERRFVHAPGAGKPVTINSLDDEFYVTKFSSAGRFWSRPPQ
jgi:cell wall-associated NlpC family hydrolase